MRLQHAHSDIDDLVLNPLDRHQPFILAITAVGFEECPDLANVLATSAMLRAGASAGATGENAVIVNAARARILAGNLANVDTPGYLARDVDYKTILGRVAQQVAAGEESQAISQGASDVHMEAQENKFVIRMRMDGVLQTIRRPDWSKSAADADTGRDNPGFPARSQFLS